METRWNLDPLYVSFGDDFKRDFAAMKKAVAEIAAWAAENLADRNVSDEKAAEIIEGYINRTNEFSEYYSLYHFAYLTASVEAEHEEANKYVDLFKNEMTNLTAPGVMFSKFVSGRGLERVFALSETCREHEFIIRKAKNDAEYMLADDVETALAKMRTTASGAWGVMKESLTAGLMVDVFLTAKDAKKELKSLPLAAVRNLAHDNDKDVRKSAYEAEINAYKGVEKPVAAALNAIKGEVLTETKLRGYDSPLDMTLKSSRMSRQTLDALITAIERYLPRLRRFYSHKAKLLGHEKYLPYFDLFAPIGAHMKFTYSEAADFIVNSFGAFGTELGTFAKKAFNERWIDAEPREGKRGGAFCLNIHSLNQSRILSNFTGTFSGVATLAHELGHAYHGHLLSPQTYMNSKYPMPIAETASTFCETLIFDAALKAAAASDEKIAVLEAQITDATQVIVDIYARYVFETNLFRQREKGPLSVNELNALMTAAQKQAYGQTLDPSTPHPYMWVNKPHYYYPARNFYNFPYAYGLMFALGLYSEYLRTGGVFINRYNNLLAVTGRMSLEDIGREAAIDVTTEDFWISSLKLIEGKVDEFCEC